MLTSPVSTTLLLLASMKRLTLLICLSSPLPDACSVSESSSIPPEALTTRSASTTLFLLPFATLWLLTGSISSDEGFMVLMLIRKKFYSY
jgi:hypothetical protein